MKSDLKTSSQDVLASVVERVTFHNEENGFCVLRAKGRSGSDLTHSARPWAMTAILRV